MSGQSGRRLAIRLAQNRNDLFVSRGAEVSPIRKDVSNVPKFGKFGTFEMSFLIGETSVVQTVPGGTGRDFHNLSTAKYKP